MFVVQRSVRKWSLVHVLAILIFLTLWWLLPLVVARQTVAAALNTTPTPRAVYATPAENLASAALETEAASVLHREELHSPGYLPESLASTSPSTTSNSLPISLVEPVYSRQTITEFLKTDTYAMIEKQDDHDLARLLGTDSSKGGSWYAYGGTDLRIFPDYYEINGTPDDTIDDQDNTSYNITWLGEIGGIYGTDLWVRKVSGETAGTPVKAIEVLFSVGDGPIEEVTLKIFYYAHPYVHIVTKENVELHDGDTFSTQVLGGVGAEIDYVQVKIDAIRHHDIGAINNPMGIAEIKTAGVVLMEIGPLEQATLLNYTTLKGVPQGRPSRTTITWTQEITSTWATTVTVPMTNTGGVTVTGTVITLTVPGELELLPDPGCVTCPLESRVLGDIVPGEVITAQWLVATTWPTNTATPTDYVWPVSIQAVADNVIIEEITGQIGAEIVYDSGYEMGRNAYYPINSPGGAYSDSVGPINWGLSHLQRRWEIFKEIYRKENLPSSPLLADKKIGFYFAAIHPRAFDAYCSGISVSNEERLSGCADLPGCGGAQDLWLWSQQSSNETIFKEEMEKYQGKILTEEALTFDLTQMARAETLPPDYRNNEVFGAVQDAIESNTTDRWVLQFLPRRSDLVGKTFQEVMEEIGNAHTVVPYMVTESAWGKRIYIYDPNKPEGNLSSPYSSVNAVRISADGYFQYDGWKDKSDQSNPDNVRDILTAFPSDFYRDAGLLPFSAYNLFGVLSPAHLAVTDDQGRALGIQAGQFVAQIPNSGPIPGVSKEIYAVPPEEAPHVVATLWGDTPGDYTYFQFQGDGLFRIQDASVTATSVDTVDVSADGLTMRYATNDAAKTYSAVLVKEGADYSRTYTAAHTSLTAGEAVTFQVSADLSTFTYINPGGAKQYDLGLEQRGVYSGAVLISNLEIGANEAHIVSVEDWGSLETTRITLGVDEGNDGSIDRTIVLQGQPDDDAPNSMEGVTETSPNNIRIERTIAPSGDEDWFRFELTEEAEIKIELNGLPADYDLYLYTASGELLDASTHRGSSGERIHLRHQPAGFYYVQVVGYAGAWDASDTYRLYCKVKVKK
ncbi:MAG: PPC domain-containing protein [Anaerolineae bacterium]|nr:PPC domain-containing protein [Anaerolineae bacterium]